MKRTILTALLMLGSLATADTQPAPATTPQATQADVMTMNRDARCGQVLVTCLIGGKPMRMMLDTGATHTVLHKESATTVTDGRWLDTSKMKFNGNANQKPEILISSLVAGPAVAPEHAFMVLDLSAVRGSLAEPLDGILGMDVLGSVPFTFDLRKNEYYWGLPSQGKIAQLRGAQDPFGRLFIQAKCAGKDLPLLLDTGSSITRVAPEQWAPGAKGEVTAQVGDVNEAARVTVQEGNPADIEVAEGVVLKQISPIFGDNSAPPVLGMDALKDQVLIHLPTEQSPFGIFLMLQ